MPRRWLLMALVLMSSVAVQASRLLEESSVEESSSSWVDEESSLTGALQLV